MNDALMQNYDKMVLKDQVAVIHTAYEDAPHTVAMAVSYTHLTLPTTPYV